MIGSNVHSPRLPNRLLCRRPRWMHSLLALSVFLLLIVGCSQSDATPAPVTPPAATSAAPGPEVSPAPVEGRQLVLWLPPFAGITADEPAGAVLDDAFYQFEQSHPGANIEVHIKAELGPAGMMALLRSAQQVAPSILPDLVLIRTQQLWQLVDLGLVPPLGQDEFPDVDDFYAFGLDAVRYRDQVHGIPYSADLLALMTDPAHDRVAPRTWDEVRLQGRPLLFAAGGGEGAGNLPALLQYVAAGGELREDGAFAAPDALEAWFDFLGEAQAQGLIDARSLDLTMSDEVWRLYQSQPDGLALVLAGDGLSQPSLAAGLAPVPTQAGQMVALGPTWALALLTTNPDQRQLAVGLVEALLAPEVQGLWSRLVHRLPSRRSALAVWTAGDGDVALVEELLESAVALPNGRPFAEFARRVQLAQLDVLRGEMTGEDAILFVRAGE